MFAAVAVDCSATHTPDADSVDPDVVRSNVDTAGRWNVLPDVAVICDDVAAIDSDVAVPVPKMNAEPPFTDTRALVRLIVVDVTTPPIEMPVLELYVTRQFAELNVMPTDDTAPPNCRHEPTVITLFPAIEIVDDVSDISAEDIAKKAPVAGCSSELVFAVMVAEATLPVAVMIFLP